jgi:hypothetical protein
MAVQDPPAFRKFLPVKGILQGIEDIPSTGVRKNPGVLGVRYGFHSQVIKFANGTRRNLRHLPTQPVPQRTVSIFEPKQGPMKRPVHAEESLCLPGRLGQLFPGKDGGCGTITKQAGADQDTGVIIEEKGGRANLDGKNRYFHGWIRMQAMVRCAYSRNRGPAAHSYKVREFTIFPQSQFFSNKATQARAQVARTGTNNEGIQIQRAQAGLIQSGA